MTQVETPASEAPSGHPWAPGALELVRGFVNSVDFEAGNDRLATIEGLRQWLEERRLLEPGDRLEEGDLERAVLFREALRAVLMAHAGHDVETGAVDTLNALAAAVHLAVRLTRDGPQLVAAGAGLDGALGHLLAAVHEAAVDGTWPRLKVCNSATCLWAYFDHSKNRSGRWCTMAVCGNRHKARAYRRRR